jgi:hypothetical protein
MWCRVVWKTGATVFEKLAAAIFRVEDVTLGERAHLKPTLYQSKIK